MSGSRFWPRPEGTHLADDEWFRLPLYVQREIVRLMEALKPHMSVRDIKRFDFGGGET